jgi:hypothetical protein
MLAALLARYSLVASCLVWAMNVSADEGTSNAPNDRMRYAAVSTQGDNAGYREVAGTLSLTFGEHAWAHVGAGTLRERRDDALSASLLNTGVGIMGEQLGGTIDFSQRKDDDRYSQVDYKAALDWHNEMFGLGLNGMHRRTKVRAIVPVATGQGSIVNVPMEQSLSGNGVGLQARYNPTVRVTLSLGGAHYSYDTQTRRDGAVADNGGNNGAINTIIDNAIRNQPLLGQNITPQVSGVTREAAVLRRSWNAGMGYRLDRAALNFKYFYDQALDGDIATNTFALNAAFYITDHWTVLPAIGHSSADQFGGNAFGSLAVGFNW